MEKGVAMNENSRFSHGIAFSLEAGLAALLLFSAMLAALQLSAVSVRPIHQIDSLAIYSEGIAQAGVKGGAFASVVSSPANDTFTKALFSSLPNSTCARAEIFHDGIEPNNLSFAYSPSDCTSPGMGSQSSHSAAFVARQNSSSSKLYFVRISAWAK